MRACCSIPRMGLMSAWDQDNPRRPASPSKVVAWGLSSTHVGAPSNCPPMPNNDWLGSASGRRRWGYNDKRRRAVDYPLGWPVLHAVQVTRERTLPAGRGSVTVAVNDWVEPTQPIVQGPPQPLLAGLRGRIARIIPERGA